VLARIVLVLWIVTFWGIVVLSYFKWHEWDAWTKALVTFVDAFLAPVGALEALRSLRQNKSDSN
jgi:hypothetical protein